MNKQLLLFPTIIADTREPGFIIEALKNVGNLSVINLEVADYVVGNIAIERKTSYDFESSIIDGRLFKQCEEMKNHYDNAIVIIEGNEIRRIEKNAYYGSIAKLIRNGVSIINVSSWKDTVNIIATLYKQLNEKKEEKKAYIVKGKKPLSLEEQKLFVLTSIKGVGKKNAELLLNHFKRLKDIGNASIQELISVGLSKKTANLVYDIFNK
jgi:ERCC4-type nuclease